MTDQQLSDRQFKALQIAATCKLTRKGNTWIVPSQAGHGEYKVNPDPESPRCTCPDYEFRNARCKHIVAVEYVLQREQLPDGSTVVTETVTVTRKSYPQQWKAYNAAQTHEKSELQALLYELCRNLPEPEKQRGRGRPSLGLADIIFSSTYKVYSTVSGRRFSTDLREAKARGYLSRLPHYNSVFRYLESEALTPYLYELISLSAAPLRAVETDFAVDSSGFSTGQFMRWLDVKYGEKEDRRQWLKLHLTCGVIQILTVQGLLAGTERPDYFDLMQGGLMSRKPEREVDAIQLGFDSAAYLSEVPTTEETPRKPARVARAAKPRKASRKTA